MLAKSTVFKNGDNKMLFMKKKNVDERIQKRSNELVAKVFPILGILALVSLIVKIVCGLPFTVYLLEICTLVIGAVVWLVEELRYGTLLVKEKDDMLRELSNKARTDAFMAMFWTVIISELLFVLVIDKTYFLWVFTFVYRRPAHFRKQEEGREHEEKSCNKNLYRFTILRSDCRI